MKKDILKLPETIKVGPVNYKVLYPYKCVDSFFRGSTHMSRGFIKVCDSDGQNTQAKQKVKETFLHEIIHAVNDVFLGDVLSEEDVTIFAIGLLQVIIDNNINFKNNTIPEKLKVCGFEYDVMYPYMYEDTSRLDASHDESRLVFRLVKQENSDVDKLNFMFLVVRAICTTYLVSDKMAGSNELCFALGSGLLSVFRDNNLEKIIKGKS